MSDNGPCNCEQSIELTEQLELLIAHIELCVDEPRHYPLRDLATNGRSVLKKYKDATLEAGRCEHCGLIGGH